jgi:hypothetical protein
MRARYLNSKKQMINATMTISAIDMEPLGARKPRTRDRNK